MKKLNSKTSGCIGTSTDCVEWVGSDIPALGITKGDCLTEVVTAIAEEVERLLEPQDLSTLELQCLIDKLNMTEPASRSITTIFQLLIDSNCYLKDFVDTALETLAGNQTPLILDLRCFISYDSFGNPLPYDEKSVLQLLLNEACANKQLVITLAGKVTSLESQVQTLSENQYKEPALNSCVYTNKPTSQAVTLLANDYCTFKGNVGSVEQIQAALGLQPSDFTAYYSAFTGWTVNPTNAAQMWGNMQIVLGDLFARTAANELCCAGTCEDIKIGFEVESNEDNTRIVLIYTEVMGTSIPSGWVDEGSVLTITDSAKRERKFYDLNVGQNLESQELDISGFLVNDMLNLCLEVKLRNTTTNEICTKCICRDFIITDSSCPVCQVTVDGTSGSVTIVYQEI